MTSIQIEGVGADWAMVRLSDASLRLIQFTTLEELRDSLQTLLQPRGEPRILPVAETLDCQTCGACCLPEDQSASSYVLLDPSERATIKATRVVAIRRPAGHFLATKTSPDEITVCAALEGVVGEQCRCSIYTKRPLACQLFEIGSPECLAARQRVSEGFATSQSPISDR